MTERPECQYCETQTDSEQELIEHMGTAHDRAELSRLDRRRVEHAEAGSESRLRRVTAELPVSRRAALATVGVGVVGGLAGLGGTVFGQSATQITDWNDLDDVRNNLGGDYVLANDLDQNTAGYSGIGDDFEPIGAVSAFTLDPFTGTFDGNGHTISDLIIDETFAFNPVGLFSATDPGAQVQGITFTNADVTYGNSSDGGGVVVGLNRGTVEDISVDGSVRTDEGLDTGGVVGNNKGTVRNAESHAEMSATSGNVSDVGGLVGTQDNGGLVENCVATGDVTVNDNRVGGLVGTNDLGGTIRDSHATGNVIDGDGDVGGLVGSNQDSAAVIERSYATGDIISSSTDDNFGGLAGENFRGTVRESYATGAVDAGSADNVGGLIGSNDDGATTTESYATGDVEGNQRVGGLVGENADDSNIEDAYALGAVDGNTAVGGVVGANAGGVARHEVRRTYAAGAVSGNTDVGGVAGANDSDGTVEASYFDTNTTGQTGGIGSPGDVNDTTGLTTDKMQGETPAPAGNDTMSEFDFNSVWFTVVAGQQINPTPGEDGYPILQALDAGVQFDAQGVPPLTAAIEVEGDNATVSNVTVSGDGS